jgi:hypothetical protein
LQNDEQVLIECIQKSSHIYEQIATLLREIKKSGFEFKVVSTHFSAVESFNQYRSSLEEISKPDRTAHRKLSPIFFRQVLSKFHCRYQVEDIDYSPPSPANIRAITEVDGLIGLKYPEQEEHLINNMHNFILSDQDLLKRAFYEPSLLEFLLKGESIEEIRKDWINRDLIPLAKLINEVCKVIGRGSAQHWGIVKNYSSPRFQLLLKEEENKESKRLHVSNMNYLRRHHPLLKKLQEALNYPQIYPQIESS